MLTAKEFAARLRARIDNLHRRCLDCFEQLTLAERNEGRAYCKACWPVEPTDEDDPC
jgi:hypothetical protein